jgi:hypothetical protein
LLAATLLLLVVLQQLHLAWHKGRYIYFQLLWLQLLQCYFARNKGWGFRFQLLLLWWLLLLQQRFHLARHKSWGINLQLSLLLHCALCRRRYNG